MRTTIASLHKSLAVITAAVLLGCSDAGPVTPERPAILPLPTQEASAAAISGDRAIVLLRRVTARYHDLNVALANGFVLLHPCEVRPGEGAVGAVYAHFGRVLDGVNDLERPDALIYEQSGNGPAQLVGVEFAIPYSLWTKDQAARPARPDLPG